eukprot:jgi/Bigna1/142594/aug1.71_g17302
MKISGIFSLPPATSTETDDLQRQISDLRVGDEGRAGRKEGKMKNRVFPLEQLRSTTLQSPGLAGDARALMKKGLDDSVKQQLKCLFTVNETLQVASEHITLNPQAPEFCVISAQILSSGQP